MSQDLPVAEKIKSELDIVETQTSALQIQQTQALQTLAESVQTIAHFLSSGGLVAVLSSYARSQAVKDILGGLAAHDGRNALDARVLTQNAIEIVHQVEKVFDKYQETLAQKNTDPEVKDAETDFRKWQSNT